MFSAKASFNLPVVGSALNFVGVMVRVGLAVGTAVGFADGGRVGEFVGFMEGVTVGDKDHCSRCSVCTRDKSVEVRRDIVVVIQDAQLRQSIITAL